MLDHIYILGPNAKKNADFIENYFAVDFKDHPGLVSTSTLMLDPTDAIYVYVVIDDNNDWLYHYSVNKADNVVIVKDF